MSDDTEDVSDKVQTARGGRADKSKNEMLDGYLPGDEDWVAKTVLDLDDPATIAALLQFGEIYPEVEEVQPIIDSFVHDFVRGKTSIGGASRQEYKAIFESVYGGGADEDSSGQVLAQALGVDTDGD